MLLLTDSQKCALAITIVDKKGNAAKVDGVPSWSSSDESVATVTAAEDGLSASVVAAGPLGTAQINVTADADLGEGVKPIAGVLEVQVVGGETASVAISAGTPEEQ